MSQSDDDLDEFRGTTGTVESNLDVDTDGHPVAEELGDEDGTRGFESDSRVTGERFAFRYETLDAFVREYIANAQTACLRRCRYELREHDADTYDDDWFDTHTLPELIEESADVAGYSPMISVHIAPESSSRDRITVVDNGIGITITEFQAMRKMGLSANHDDGTITGNFGQGIVSVFPAVSKYGEAQFTTRDRRTGVSYAERMTLNGFEDIDGTRDEYGTEWRIPGLGEDAKGLDLEQSVERYTKGIYVPVVVHSYDTQGAEVDQTEYVYEPLVEWPDDDQPVIHYEDEWIEAIASPDIGGHNKPLDPIRLLISFPIDADDTGAYHSPWQFIYRLKKENGVVWQCTHEDADHIDTSPIEEIGYQRLDDEDRTDHVSKDDLEPVDLSEIDRDGMPEDRDIVLEEPVDDRDRFRDHDERMARVLSAELYQVFVERATAIFEQFDTGFDTFWDLSDAERTIMYCAIEMEANVIDADAVIDTVDYYGVRLSQTVASRIAGLFDDVARIDRETTNPEHAGNQTDTQIGRVLDRVGQDGDVYMAVSPNEDKCHLAWALSADTEVVVVDSTEKYEQYALLYGWIPLKELELRGIADKYDVPDSLAAQLDRGEMSTATDRDFDLDAASRTIKLRQATKREYTEYPVEDVVDRLADDTLTVTTNHIRDLLVFRETDVFGVETGADATAGPIARTIVPNYVANYLEGTDNVHIVDEDTWLDTVAEIRARYGETEVETIPLHQFSDEFSDVESTDQTSLDRYPPEVIDSDTTITADQLADDPNGLITESISLSELGAETLVVAVPQKITELLTEDDDTSVTPEDRALGLCQKIQATASGSMDDSLGDFERVVALDRQTIVENLHCFGAHADGFPETDASPTILRQRELKQLPTVSDEYWRSSHDLTVDVLLPDSVFDHNAPEWDAMIADNTYDIRNGREKGEAIIDFLYDMAERTDDDTAIFPSNRD